MSVKASGPIGMPNRVAALSIDSIERPSCNRILTFVHVREEHAIDQEARAVVDDDRRLADSLGERHDRRDRHVAGLRPADDLDQLHPIDRTEEMHADELLGVRSRLGHPRDRDRRGIARQDRVGPDHLGKPL